MTTAVPRAAIAAWACAMFGAAIGAQSPKRCRIEGSVTSGKIPLPGVSIVVRTGDGLSAATSTGTDGRYSLSIPSGARSRLSANFTGFVSADRELTVSGPSCDQTLDLELALEPRLATSATPATPAARAPATPATQTAPRFPTLNVQSNDAGAATAQTTTSPEAEDVSPLVPAGFSIENAQADAIAITGRTDAANFDRSLLNDRMQAIAVGQFDPATGQFAPGFGPPDGAAGGQGPGGFGGGRLGGPGGGPGGGGGRGGFLLGGRGARGQHPYQGSMTYTFGGSALDAAPYQLRSDVPVNEPAFAQNTFGATFGGPVRIPGLYANTNRRTTFQLNYTGNESNNLFDQYATVPTGAMRSGDFSASPISLIDPISGQPFAGNQVPASRIDPSAASLLPYIPAPNLPGAAQNYHVSTTAHTSSEAISLRVTQNLSPTVPQGGQGGQGGQGPGARAGFGGGFGGRGGGGGRGFGSGRGTNIFLSGQLQYRRIDTEALNVFPDLGGETISTGITAPITLTVARNRSVHLFTVNTTHSSIDSTNAFTNTQDVAGLAGIQYPSAASTDPLNWGVPNLSFSGFTGVRGASASQRSDTRLTTSYAWINPT